MTYPANWAVQDGLLQEIVRWRVLGPGVVVRSPGCAAAQYGASGVPWETDWLFMTSAVAPSTSACWKTEDGFAVLGRGVEQLGGVDFDSISGSSGARWARSRCTRPRRRGRDRRAGPARRECVEARGASVTSTRSFQSRCPFEYGGRITRSSSVADPALPGATAAGLSRSCDRPRSRPRTCARSCWSRLGSRLSARCCSEFGVPTALDNPKHDVALGAVRVESRAQHRRRQPPRQFRHPTQRPRWLPPPPGSPGSSPAGMPRPQGHAHWAGHAGWFRRAACRLSSRPGRACRPSFRRTGCPPRPSSRRLAEPRRICARRGFLRARTGGSPAAPPLARSSCCSGGAAGLAGLVCHRATRPPSNPERAFLG
jgi:hypothetical protein